MVTLEIAVPDKFSFDSTIRSHGWYDLLPFVLDEENRALSYVFQGSNDLRPVHVTIRERGEKLRIEVGDGDFE